MPGDIGLAAIRARAEAAAEHVGRLASGEDRWKMNVPVQDDDSDVLLMTVADKDVPWLLAEVEALRSTIARVRKAVESHIGAPCGCNAIAYQVRAAIEGADS